MQLAELVLQELRQHKKSSTFIHHIAFLTSQFYLKNVVCSIIHTLFTKLIFALSQGDKKKALMYLLSTIHIHPDSMLLRNVLAHFLLSNYKKSQKYLIAASRIAQSTISLQLALFERFELFYFSLENS